jgi:ketosteroid isomerase-like protein
MWAPLFALAFACQPGSVAITDRALIVQAVQGRLAVWTRAVNNRSLDTLSMLYGHTREVTALWPDGAETRGWNETSARWKEWVESLTQLNFVTYNAQVDVIDRRVAVAIFRTSTDVLTGRERLREAGRATQVWVLDASDGRWKIQLEHRSAVP